MTSPEIEKKRNPAAVLCVALAVLCVALGVAAWYFWRNVSTANERAEQAEARADEMAGYCESLIRSGQVAVDRADELLAEADEEITELQTAAGYRFTGGIYRNEYDKFLIDTWNHTVETIQGKEP